MDNHYQVGIEAIHQMDRKITMQQMLYMILSEEASEITKEVSKIFRFGAMDLHKGVPNISRLQQECIDTMAIIKMTKILDGLSENDINHMINIKINKTIKYLGISQEMGTLRVAVDDPWIPAMPLKIREIQEEHFSAGHSLISNSIDNLL
jgi:hypothetical protein